MRDANNCGAQAILIAIASRGYKLSGAVVSALSEDGDAPADFEMTVLHG
jgi:hypothetical protein